MGNHHQQKTSSKVGVNLPPGFRFEPKDHEMLFYLQEKMKNNPIPIEIEDVDLCQYTPQALSEKYSRLGEKYWYFFTLRKSRYPKGSRPSRKGGSGSWKAQGKEKEVLSQAGKVIGWKRTLVFLQQKCKKTGWIMHEFGVGHPQSGRYAKGMKLDRVLCRIYERAPRLKGNEHQSHQVNESGPNSQVEQVTNTEVPIFDNIEEDPAGVFANHDNYGANHDNYGSNHDNYGNPAAFVTPQYVGIEHYDSNHDNYGNLAAFVTPQYGVMDVLDGSAGCPVPSIKDILNVPYWPAVLTNGGLSPTFPEQQSSSGLSGPVPANSHLSPTFPEQQLNIPRRFGHRTDSLVG